MKRQRLLLSVCVAVLGLSGCSDMQADHLECFLTGGVFATRQVYVPREPRYECVYGGTKSAAASAGDVLFVSAVAHAGGVQGTNWRTDLQVHNLGDELAVFRLWLLEHGGDNTNPAEIELSLAAGHSLRMNDVVADDFGVDGTAALIVSPSSGRIVVTSRTYNLLGTGNALGLPPGATFGQFIPALTAGGAIRFGEEGRIIHLSHSDAIDGGARTNLGLVNATGAELQAKVALFSADGALLGTVSRTLPPFGYRQINRVFAAVTGDDVADGYAVVHTTTPDGVFFAYASVVDNLTGDPVAITAARLPEIAPDGPGDPVYVVAAAHVAGAAGTNWRTDLEVHCWSDQPSEFTIELLEHGADNSNPGGRTFELGSGQSRRFDDVLSSVFNFEGAAALRITPSGGRLLVTSRTYNQLGPNNELGLPAGATFGQFIPGVTGDRAIGWGEHGRLIQLAHSEDDASGFRTNLVLVNATDGNIDIEAVLFDANGTYLGTVDRSLKPYEYRQLNRVFASVTADTVDDGFAVVRAVTEGGRFFALASVVDNLTGDPVGMSASPLLLPGSEQILSGVQETLDALGEVGVGTVIERIQTIGVDDLIDGLIAELGDVVFSTSHGFNMDYGTSWLAPDGTVYSGSVEVDTSGLTVDSGGISGTMTITYDDYLVDGEPPVIGPTQWTFGLTERADGTVVGDITVGPAGSLKSAGSLSGTVGIDTEICLEYPISGSLTAVVENEVITITFSPDCDGGIDHEIEPSDVFSYSYGDPAGPNAREYIVSDTNAEVGIEGSAHYWRPMVGGEEFDETAPGVITYHFPFDRPIIGGRLYATLAVWHFWYSRGHAFLYGSTDGVDWELLVEVEPPDLDQGRGGSWNDDLPEMFIGETDIWLQGRLFSYGPRAAAGGIYCNTAEMSRWDANGPTTTFELEVELE